MALDTPVHKQLHLPHGCRLAVRSLMASPPNFCSSYRPDAPEGQARQSVTPVSLLWFAPHELRAFSLSHSSNAPRLQLP